MTTSRPDVLHSAPDCRRCAILHTGAGPGPGPPQGICGGTLAADGAAVRYGGRSMRSHQCRAMTSANPSLWAVRGEGKGAGDYAR